MQHLMLTITLASDAEPGSGIGATGLDQCLPRDLDGRPMLQASHVKGLMLDALRQISQERNWPRELEAAVFGAPDAAYSRVQVGDACLAPEAIPLTISRTAVAPDGSKRTGSLRTVEALPCGNVLTAPLRLDCQAGDAVDLAGRLAALSVSAVGGGRNRGAGACQVTLSGESRRPGDLLKVLDAQLRSGVCPQPAAIAPRADPLPLNGHRDAVLRRVVFVADGPICCPERPVAAGNTIETGIAIPASAVQGMLLTVLNAHNGPMATACFDDVRFRAWPLHPVTPAAEVAGGSDDVAGLDDLPHAVRAPRSLRISKLRRDDGTYVLGDAAIAPLPPNEPSPGAPLRATDGVLLVRPRRPTQLWRAPTIPRALSTHGVHRDGDDRRNLFSALSLAPMVFTGLLSLPPEVADALDEALRQDAHVTAGKARSVRGSGRLQLAATTWEESLHHEGLPADLTDRVFVVQSPLAIPDEWPVGRAVDVLGRLVQAAGWPDIDFAASQAHCGLRFGWNRHGIGPQVGEHRRLKARRCVLPGSVIVLTEPLRDQAAKLLTGIGAGREAGFGAVLPHPGIADEVVSIEPRLETLASDGAGELALELWRRSGGAHGPSAAQIGAVRERLKHDITKGRQYLDQQRRERPARFWQRWEPVYELLMTELQARPGVVVKALKGWQDLAAANKEERR